MKPGPILRRALGPAERWATGVYRRFFIDLRRFAADVAGALSPAAILDVGCGEGQSTEALAAAFQRASIVGVDVTPRVGRLFRGDGKRVRFLQQQLDQFAAGRSRAFDLVVMCDVLHHIPASEHERFLRNATACLRTGGWLVLKEWEPRRNAAHLLCCLSDRYLTGDRVCYAHRNQLRSLLDAIPSISVVHESTVRPWPNNVAIWARMDY